MSGTKKHICLQLGHVLKADSGTLPPTNIAPVGGCLEDPSPLVGTPLSGAMLVGGRADEGE